jgi:acetyl-CoA carboxylase / biotin carboxylase 1
MAALGDKVGSTILAQSAGVPTLPWSGSGVTLAPAAAGGHGGLGGVSEAVYRTACVHDVDAAVESCGRIGFPAMLKARRCCSCTCITARVVSAPLCMLSILLNR